MRLLINYRQDFDREKPVESYARSAHQSFLDLGHEVTAMGEGHKLTFEAVRLRNYDLLLDLDNGRNRKGEFDFVLPKHKINIPTAIWLIDTHGQVDLHTSINPWYDHVFFAVWSKRDIFTGHPSAHWCPNATDINFFRRATFEPSIDFGFFGSKGGLDRADTMKAICVKNQWTFDVRQINGAWKHKFPATGDAMGKCKILFNHGQKHDGPNLRVMESMACGRPLISDFDERSGMSKLFEEGKHYLSYTPESLESEMRAAVVYSGAARDMAERAYVEVTSKHLVKHRVQQMLEVFKG